MLHFLQQLCNANMLFTYSHAKQYILLVTSANMLKASTTNAKCIWNSCLDQVLEFHLARETQNCK